MDLRLLNNVGNIKDLLGSSEMVQWERALGSELDNLNSIPRTHVIEREH